MVQHEMRRAPNSGLSTTVQSANQGCHHPIVEPWFECPGCPQNIQPGICQRCPETASADRFTMDGSHIFLSAVGGDDAVAHSPEQAFPANFGCLYGVWIDFNRLSTAQLCSSDNPVVPHTSTAARKVFKCRGSSFVRIGSW